MLRGQITTKQSTQVKAVRNSPTQSLQPPTERKRAQGYPTNMYQASSAKDQIDVRAYHLR